MFAETGCPYFDRDFRKLAALAEVQVATPEALSALLGEMYASIFDVDFANYRVEVLAPKSETILAQVNNLRITLRDRIPQWSRAGLMTAEVQRRLRDVFRASRYATDMLGELMIGYDDLSPGEEEYPAFTGPHLNTLIHPGLGDSGGALEIRTGDIIVVRGTIHNSAAIARIGDVDSQFSHVGIVHIGPDGRKVIVETTVYAGDVATARGEVVAVQMPESFGD